MSAWKPVLKPASRVTAAEMREVLRSPQLATVERAIAEAVGLPVSDDGDVAYALNAVYFLDWDAGAIVELLAARREALVAFGVRLARHEDAADERDGEFPPGEELSAGDRSAATPAESLAHGFGVRYLVFHHLATVGSAAFARDYLKSLRIPFAARFAKRLRAYAGGG